MLGKNKFNSNRSKKDWFVRNNYEQEYDSIIALTDFLSENSPFRYRLQCILKDISCPNLCKVCGSFTNYNPTKNEFGNYCSYTCSNKDKDYQDITTKIRQTKKYRYDNENYCNADKIKNTKQIGYDDSLHDNKKNKFSNWPKQTFDPRALIRKKDNKVNIHLAKLHENIIISKTSDIDFLNPKLSNRVKYFLYPPIDGIYCKCGNPKSFSPHANESFKKSCGNMKCAVSHINREISSKKRQDTIIKNKKIKSNFVYTTDEQKEYIQSYMNEDVKNPLILSKNTDICVYMKQQAKKHNLNNIQYCYHIINNMELYIPKCSCGTLLTFKSFKDGYRNICTSCQLKEVQQSKSEIAIQKAKDALNNFNIINCGKLGELPWVLQCNECEHTFEKWLNNGIWKHNNIKCPKCYPTNKSSYEYDLIDKIKEFYNGKIIHTYQLKGSDNRGNCKSIDIYIPEFKLGIEINGLYWHSVNHNKVDKRHVEKIELCNEEGIQLLQFTDLELDNSYDICISIIKNRMNMNKKVYARKTVIKEISNKEYQNFCIENHLKGYSPSKIKYGLFYRNDMVMIIGLSKSRYTKELDKYELIRLCSKLNITVIGGFSKVLSHINQNHLEIKKIESFCDLTHGTGNGYKAVGFKFHYNTKPNYYYYKTNGPRHLESRLKFQKHKLKDILEDFDPSLTEKENMINNGYRLYYDCGNAKYAMSL